MPLNTRKSLKAAQDKIDKNMKDSSMLFGKELTWIDNYQELFDRLKKSGRGDDWLWKLGDQIAPYTLQLSKVFSTFCKDTDNKEALEEVLTTGKIGVRIIDDKAQDQYWCIADGILWMETKAGWFGSWLDNFSSDKLEKKL